MDAEGRRTGAQQRLDEFNAIHERRKLPYYDALGVPTSATEVTLCGCLAPPNFGTLNLVSGGETRHDPSDDGCASGPSVGSPP